MFPGGRDLRGGFLRVLFLTDIDEEFNQPRWFASGKGNLSARPGTVSQRKIILLTGAKMASVRRRNVSNPRGKYATKVPQRCHEAAVCFAAASVQGSLGYFWSWNSCIQESLCRSHTEEVLAATTSRSGKRGRKKESTGRVPLTARNIDCAT